MDHAFEKELEELERSGSLRVEREAPLSKLCSFRIGGPAEYALFPKNESGFIGVCSALRGAGMPIRVVGNASNILFPDEGVRGAVVFMTAMSGARFSGRSVTARAGERVTALASKAKKKGLAGLEFYYGIPGSVGGAVYMNAGAYEHETAEVLDHSRCYDVKTGEITELKKEEHDFSYRHSAYAGTSRVLLSATYLLTPANEEEIGGRMEDYMARRKSKQPLEYPSAGSVFKRYPGYFTAKLIDEAGLKGRAVGGAQVAVKHAGFIINTGGATAKDVKELVKIVEEELYRRNGIRIERELIYF